MHRNAYRTRVVIAVAVPALLKIRRRLDPHRGQALAPARGNARDRCGDPQTYKATAPVRHHLAQGARREQKLSLQRRAPLHSKTQKRGRAGGHQTRRLRAQRHAPADVELLTQASAIERERAGQRRTVLQVQSLQFCAVQLEARQSFTLRGVESFERRGAHVQRRQVDALRDVHFNESRVVRELRGERGERGKVQRAQGLYRGERRERDGAFRVQAPREIEALEKGKTARGYAPQGGLRARRGDRRARDGHRPQRAPRWMRG
mmetsp:Transcript_166/g.656  ORF Transcript_166/g.656 Transcript_166/m.656 type:complete len:262 (+) Transcript_166:591-1376(+)